MLFLGEQQELNPPMVDSQSIALIHLAISTPILLIVEITIVFKSELFKELKNGEIKGF